MDVQIVRLQTSRVVMLRHSGPYEGLDAKFEQLWEWVEAQSVPVQRTIGIYWDNPEFTPATRLRSAACVEVPAGYKAPNIGSLPLEIGELAGGEYATTRYVGPYDGLAKVWSGMTTHVERTLGRKISENPAYEVYVNDPSDTAPSELITELFTPLL